MAAHVGTVVQLNSYHWRTRDAPPAVGEYLRSPGGAYYRILAVEPAALYGDTFAIRAIKLGAEVDTDGARVLPLEPR